MFDYPLPVPRNTHYLSIGVEPEATTEEIRDASEEIIIELNSQKKAVDLLIGEVYQRVAGLKNAYDAVEALHHQSQEADPGELGLALKTLAQLEQTAAKVNPQFKQLRARAIELELKINEINRLALQNPEARLAYDRSTPPLELLKLASCTLDEFTNNRTAIVLLRRELSAFIANRGEEVFQPSDLTRANFTSDFSFNSILDD
jgi:hypothetical protein